jgi:hypothetical protein
MRRDKKPCFLIYTPADGMQKFIADDAWDK